MYTGEKCMRCLDETIGLFGTKTINKLDPIRSTNYILCVF